MKTIITKENFEEKAREYLKKIGIKIMPDWLGDGTVCGAVYGICEGCIFHGECGSRIFTDEHISRLQKYIDEQEKDMDKHDMTLREAQKIYDRMCNKYNPDACKGCPLVKNGCSFFRNDILEIMLRILTDWNAAHPVKTNLDLMKEKIEKEGSGNFIRTISGAFEIITDNNFQVSARKESALIDWLNSPAEEE